MATSTVKQAWGGWLFRASAAVVFLVGLAILSGPFLWLFEVIGISWWIILGAWIAAMAITMFLMDAMDDAPSEPWPILGVVGMFFLWWIFLLFVSLAFAIE